MLVDDPDLAHLWQTCGFSRQLVVGVTPGCRAVSFVPSDRIAQQEIDELQAALGLLCQRLRQIAELAVVRGDDVIVRAPGIVSGRARERGDGQHPDGDDPEPQACRARCIREQ